MTSARIKSLLIGVGLFSMLALVACQRQPSVQKAEVRVQETESKACQALAQLKQSLATLGAVNEKSTVGEVRKAQQNVAQSLAALKQSLAAVDQARTKLLDAANTELEKATKALPNQDTLSQAAATLKPKVAAVEAARAQFGSQLNCAP